MIFATDLDNTMIFSHKLVIGLEDELHCVEYHNGKPITYMTHSAVQKVKFLMDKIFVIPITSRSISQFKRVELFSSAEYAVTDNGGIILHNGIINEKWNDYINSILMKYDLNDTYEIFRSLPGLISQPRIVDGRFIFAKSDEIDLCTEILKCKLDTKLWHISFHCQKIYAIPAEITKGAALKFISEHLIKDNSSLIVAGDSNLDLSMLACSNCSIIPKDSELAETNNGELIEMGYGIDSTDEILQFVINRFKI